jgi:hypothetical protein
MADRVGPAARHGAQESHPPERPTDLSRQALEFVRQPATRWLNPDVLVGSGVRHVLTSAFGSFLDKRELQAKVPLEVDRRFADAPALWFDYIADTGDGFDSTYTMASLLARRELTLGDDPTPLRRGQLVVLGGDEVYPVATTENYEQRLAGPLRAALPWTVSDHPTLYALPGNHDWYDGLTGFLRLFGQHRWIGGWQTRQTRSYFAVQLPHRWWLWGMDIQSDQYIDEPQLRFFGEVLEDSRPGDRLILATAEPSWIETERRHEAYRNIAYVQHSLLRPHGVELKLAVAGDLHHYNHYAHNPGEDEPTAGDKPGGTGSNDVRRDRAPDVSPPTHLVTAGGGGAFLHPTHDLPRDLHLPVSPTRINATSGYRLQRCYPTRRRSRLLAWLAVFLPFRNPGFLWVGALLQVSFLWINLFGLRSLSRDASVSPSYAVAARGASWRDLATGLIRNPIAGVSLLLLAGALIGLARKPPWSRRRFTQLGVRVALGLVHTAMHAVALVAVGLASIALAAELATGVWFAVLTSLFAGIGGGVISAAIVGAYFALANTCGLRVHGNEAFSASRLASYRSFLRMRLDEDGSLTVYVIGVDRVTRRWRTDADTLDPERSWLVPAGRSVAPHLVDRIVVGPRD